MDPQTQNPNTPTPPDQPSSLPSQDGWGAYGIALEYPTSSNNSPRWGGFAASHAELSRLMEGAGESQQDVLKKIIEVSRCCHSVAETLEESDPEPRWRNPMMAGLDACTIGAFLSSNPSLYLEIGSGHSTKFARHFIRKLGLRTKLVSVDPNPRSECDQLCDEIIRSPLEDVELRLFERLQPGDILFIDGSHRCFMNSDVTVFFVDILPRLSPGVITGVHDIFIPDDYPAEWKLRYYNEQYLLATHLLGARDRIQVLFGAYFQCKSEDSREALAEARTLNGCPPDTFHGCGFWFTHRD